MILRSIHKRLQSTSMIMIWTLLLELLVSPVAAVSRNITYVEGYASNGQEMLFRADRYPALYTGDFGDCLDSGSQFMINKFDAALYYDNMTVLFHLDGTTSLIDDMVMLRIFVYAYGEERFSIMFDPCAYSVYSMCPTTLTKNITAWGAISLSTDQLSFVPDIALTVPDFEGYARLYVYSNITKNVVGCFQAPMRNGHTFYQPRFVVPFIGIFTGVAVVASFLTAVYGFSIPHIRMHQAHALSVLNIFELYQSMFLHSLVAIPWPGVLPAWWSNFSWASGMIPVHGLVVTLRKWSGIKGDPDYVGMMAGETQPDDGNFDLLKTLYGRTEEIVRRARTPFNPENPWDYQWNGNPILPGMPMPGTYFGFGGGLTPVQIPTASAFTVALVWFLVFFLIVAAAVIFFRLSLAVLNKTPLKTNSFDYFKSHLWGYTALAVARYTLLAFVPLLTIAIFQLSLSAPPGPKAIGAIIFILLLVSLLGIVGYAVYIKIKDGHFSVVSDFIRVEKIYIIKEKMLFIELIRTSKLGEAEAQDNQKIFFTIPFLRIVFTPNNTETLREMTHDNVAYIKQFSWLSGNYRKSRWWYFGGWTFYQFVKAIILGGGENTPAAQLAILFIVELCYFVTSVIINPFEGTRNTAMLWMTGISKVVTVILTFPLLESVGTDRIIATVIGIIIIIVQGFVIIAVFILIVLSALSTWMSLRRNSETFPRSMESHRIDFYSKMEKRAADLPAERKVKSSRGIKKTSDDEEKQNAEPIPGFKVSRVRRVTKGEEEDIGYHLSSPTSRPTTLLDPSTSGADSDTPVPSSPSSLKGGKIPGTRQSRSNSVSSIPRAARQLKVSWSSRDFTGVDPTSSVFPAKRPDSALAQQICAAAAQQLAIHKIGAAAIQPPLEPTPEVDDITNKSISPVQDVTPSEAPVNDSLETPPIETYKPIPTSFKNHPESGPVETNNGKAEAINVTSHDIDNKDTLQEPVEAKQTTDSEQRSET